MLLFAGVVTRSQLDRALGAQGISGLRVGEELVRRGDVSEVELTQVLSNQLQVPWISVAELEPLPALVSLIPAGLARQWRCIPVYTGSQGSPSKSFRTSSQSALYVAMADPTCGDAILELERTTGRLIQPMLAPWTEIEDALGRLYPSGEVAHETTGAKPPTDPRTPPGTGACLPTPISEPSDPATTGASPETLPAWTLLDGTRVVSPPDNRGETVALARSLPASAIESPTEETASSYRLDGLLQLLVKKGILEPGELQEYLAERTSSKRS